jgi:nucleotide-binding universal stress UspA family protein
MLLLGARVSRALSPPAEPYEFQLLMLLSNRGAVREEALEMDTFPTRILLATDGTKDAELAARRAIDLAEGTGSELHVVHVGLVPNFLVEGTLYQEYNRKLYEEIEQESRELLRRLTWQVKVAGGSVTRSHLRMGVVDLEIVGLARELEADMIVMGCRGRGGIRRAIEGSVSDAVVRQAPCPVLVVRSHESAEAPV